MNHHRHHHYCWCCLDAVIDNRHTDFSEFLATDFYPYRRFFLFLDRWLSFEVSRVGLSIYLSSFMSFSSFDRSPFKEIFKFKKEKKIFKRFFIKQIGPSIFYILEWLLLTRKTFSTSRSFRFFPSIHRYNWQIFVPRQRMFFHQFSILIDFAHSRDDYKL